MWTWRPRVMTACVRQCSPSQPALSVFRSCSLTASSAHPLPLSPSSHFPRSLLLLFPSPSLLPSQVYSLSLPPSLFTFSPFSSFSQTCPRFLPSLSTSLPQQVYLSSTAVQCYTPGDLYKCHRHRHRRRTGANGPVSARVGVILGHVAVSRQVRRGMETDTPAQRHACVRA